MADAAMAAAVADPEVLTTESEIGKLRQEAWEIGFQQGRQQGGNEVRAAWLHPENRYIVASLIGAAVIDDPVEFGNWCKHGFELLKQFRLGERDERVMFERANQRLQDQPNVNFGGDRIPFAAHEGREPSPELAARWQERFQRNLASGAYTDPDGGSQFFSGQPGRHVPPAGVPEAALAQRPMPEYQPADMSAVVQDLVRQELAKLQGSAYGAGGMPVAPTPQPAPSPIVRPTSQWTNAGFGVTPGYVPRR